MGRPHDFTIYQEKPGKTGQKKTKKKTGQG